MKRYTMLEIREANIAAGFHTFDRKTLRFFGETMRNYSAGEVGATGCQYVYRNGGKAGNAVFLFNPLEGSCRKITSEKGTA